MKRHFLWMSVLACMVIFTGCHRRELSELPPQSTVPVLFSQSELAIESVSKSDGTLPAGTTVRVVVFQGGNYFTENTYRVTPEGALTACTVDGATGAYAGSGEALHLRRGAYSFHAYAPAVSTDAGHGQVEGITHGVDLLGAAEVTQTITGPAIVPMAFSHRMSKVSFLVKPREGFTPTSLAATSATLDNMSGVPASYTIATNSVTGIAGSSTATISGFTAADAVTSGGSAIVIPRRTPDDLGLTIGLTLDGEDKELSATIPDQAFDEGNHYQFIARVGPETVDLYIKVLPWTTVTDPAGEIGEQPILVGRWVWKDNPEQIGEQPILVGRWVWKNNPEQIGEGQICSESWEYISSTDQMGV